MLATVMNMLNIPFKDCFTVNTLWDVRPTLTGGCKVVIRLKVGMPLMNEGICCIKSQSSTFKIHAAGQPRGWVVDALYLHVRCALSVLVSAF